MARIVLDRIELRDFKSFRGEHMIGPFHPFSGIIGPNGSGKSNILDSLGFALFLDPNPRSTNYIYHDPASVDPVATSCYVRVILKKGNDELSFERQINEGGETLLINGDETSQETYENELQKLNIVPLCFIKQSEVDLIARKTPIELTALFEEMSGSADYINDYEEYRIKAESAQEDVSLLDKRKRSAKAEKSFITHRQKEAKEYLELVKEEEKLTLETAMLQLHNLDTLMKGYRKEMSTLNDDCTKKEKKLEKMERERKELQEATNDVIDKITGIDNELDQVQQQLREKRAEKMTTNVHLEFFEKQLKETENAISAGEASLREREDRRERDEEERNRIIEKLKDMPDLSAFKEDIALFESIDRQSRIMNAAATKAFREITDNYEKAKRDLENSRDAEQRSEESLKRTKTELANLNESKKKAESDKVSATITVRGNETKIGELTSKIENMERERKALSDKMAALNIEMESMRRKQGISKSKERKMKAVAYLVKFLPGCYGTFMQLCKPIESHKVAVLAGLGGNTEALIVKDRDTSRKAVEYFKEQGVGEITCMALNEMTVPSKRPDGVTFLSRYITSSDSRYKPAIEHLAGSIGVVNTTAEAMKLSFSKNIIVVTKDGTVVRPEGIVETGSDHESASYNAAKLEENEKKRISVNAELEKKSDELEKARAELQKVETAQLTARPQLESIKRRLAELENTIKLYESNRRTTEANLKETQNETKRKEKELEAAQQKYVKAADEQRKQNEALYEGVTFSTGFDSVYKLRDEYAERLKYEDRLKQIEARLSSGPSVELDELRGRREEYSSSVTDAQSRINELKEEIAELEKNEKKLETEKGDLNSSDISNRAELREKNLNAKRLGDKIKDLREKYAENSGMLEAAKQKFSSVITRCRISNVKLPRADRADDEDSLPQSTLSSESQIDKDVEEGSNIDYSALSAALRSMTSDAVESRVKINESKIATIRAKIHAVRPDLKSEDRMKQVDLDIENTQKEAQEASNKAKEMKMKFVSAREKRRELFMQLYDDVDATIDRIYKNLTRERHIDRAGTAYLAIEDTDEPYLGGIKFTAMPPHKRFRDLDQLSGGEKAVASLALIMALQKHIKAPFILMDEPDASLDKINLRSAATALRDMAEDEDGSQIICVSLRDRFFEYADTLTGVYRDLDKQSSGVITLDLTRYKEASLKMEEI